MSDKKRVVVIDDEPEFCHMVKEVLEATGEYEVAVTSDPLQAENVIRQAKPELLLLDIVMPKRKGTDIIDALRKDEALKRLPIVVVSGKGEMIYDKKKHDFKWTPNNPVVKERGKLPDVKGAEALSQAYGVTDYISKPFTNQILIDVLAEVFTKIYKKKAADQEGPALE